VNNKDRPVPKIGVALSGGGVRGLAHLGVLQVLEEARIPVAMLAGASMGGIVAGLVAAGVPIQKLIAFSERTGIVDLASRDAEWRGLFGHKKMTRMLARLLGREDITFEELDIPAAVTAADVETGELVVLDKGPLIPALLATSAVPIIFAPVRHQGRWLVDGGVLNNFPVDIVRKMGADRVLGVNVPPSVSLPLDNQGQGKATVPAPRGLRFLGNRAHDWRLPFLIAEASVGLTVGVISRMRLMHYPPDLLLEVRLTNVGTFATDKSAQAIEAGRKAAMKHLAELVELKTAPLPPRWRRDLAAKSRRLRRAWDVLHETDGALVPGHFRPRTGG